MKTNVIKSNYDFFSSEFVKAYILTMHPYLMFVSGITGIAGMSLGKDIPSINYLPLFFASFLSYGFGQALTDCFQIDTDSISSPYRPLTRGLISRNQVFTISITGLILCVAAFSFYNPVNLLPGLAAGIGLATYTPFKRKWWSGPFYNSWIVSMLFLMSYLSVSTKVDLFFKNDFIFIFLTVFFVYANFVLSGYFKDISADKSTGYYTFPVKYGRRISAAISDVFAFLTVVFSVQSIEILLPLRLNYGFLFPAIFLLSGFAASFTGQLILHRVKSDAEAFHAIKYTVHSYILILSSIAAAHKPEWSLPLILYYSIYIFVLKYRPAENQI